MQRIEAIRERLKAAHTMVSDLCHGRRDWVMSIPARPDYDPDLVIGAALSDGDKLMVIAEASLALYRAEHAHDDPRTDPNALDSVRAAWYAACAKWE